MLMPSSEEHGAAGEEACRSCRVGWSRVKESYIAKGQAGRATGRASYPAGRPRVVA
jgi:hypothetical protein